MNQHSTGGKPQVLRLRSHIILLVKKRKMSYLKKNMKFGIKVPTSIAHAYELNCINGNTLWADGIAKEIYLNRLSLFEP